MLKNCIKNITHFDTPPKETNVHEKEEVVHKVTKVSPATTILEERKPISLTRAELFFDVTILPPQADDMKEFLINGSLYMKNTGTSVLRSPVICIKVTPAESAALQGQIIPPRLVSGLSTKSNGAEKGWKYVYEDWRERIRTKGEYWITPIQPLEILPNDFVFIFVGRLVSDKGINELTAAFKKLNNLFSNAKLLLVGPLETELDPLKPQTLKEIEHNKSIISVGYQNDVRPYFSISNALVFPSYREGFPNVVMQAGAMGLPSIVSDINGCNEIVIEKHNGLIIPVKNANAIFEAMNEMITNIILYADLKEHARKRIVDNYEQKVVWKAILEEYKKLETNKS